MRDDRTGLVIPRAPDSIPVPLGTVDPLGYVVMRLGSIGSGLPAFGWTGSPMWYLDEIGPAGSGGPVQLGA